MPEVGKITQLSDKPGEPKFAGRAVRRPQVAKPSKEDLKNRFTYHPVGDDHVRGAHLGTVRDRLCDVASKLIEIVPEGRELSLALTKLEEAMFWANAGIAREGQ